MNNLAITLFRLGRLPAAEAAFKKALEIKPDYLLPYPNLIYMLSLQQRYQ